MGYTKINDNLSVHQSLSDEPNIDDGLAAEELKKKFDEPAEKLKKAFNDFINELENKVGATGIYAQPIYDGDTTDNNIQAKLSKLHTEIQQTVLGQIPDGSITKPKINSAVFDEIYAYKNYVIGNYTGNCPINESSAEQEISLDFTPSAVIISSSKFPASNDVEHITALGTTNVQITKDNIVSNIVLAQIKENGFKVKHINTNNYSAGFNKENTTYTYIAFK